MLGVVLSTNLFAKAFGRNVSDIAYSIIQTSDGGFAVAGETDSLGVLVLKLSPNGSLEWAKTFNPPLPYAAAYSIIQTSDGGYAVAGILKETVTLVLKLSSDGSLEWAKTFERGPYFNVAKSIIQTSDGGFAVAGWTGRVGGGDFDIFVLKLSPNGSLEWAETFGVNGSETASSIVQTSDGGFAVAGEMGDILVLKLSSDGSLEWAKTFGGTGWDRAYSIVQTSDGGFAVAGRTGSFGAGSYDILVLKLSSDGSLEWAKTFGGTSDESAYSIVQTSDGGFAVAGGTWSFGAGSADLLVLKLSPNGSLEWAKTFGDLYSEEAYSIIQTSDGGFAVAGWTRSVSPGVEDFLVLTLNPDGSYRYCLYDATPTELSVSPVVNSPFIPNFDLSFSVDSSFSASDVSLSAEDVCPPGALCESSFSPRLACSLFPGGVLFTSPVETEIKIYTVDGKLARSLELRKGRNRVYLKPGVYLWQAGGQGGKAIVR